MSKPLRIISLALVLLVLPQLASTQSTTLVRQSPPEIDTFPTITALMKVWDEKRQFVSGLTAQDITILEDDQRIRVTELNELRPGVQLVVAINPGPTFAFLNTQGITRYDYLVTALERWSTSLKGSTIDNLSLLTNSGPNENHLSSINTWLNALREAPSDHRNAMPSLQILSRAIDVASDPIPREGMGRAILLITQNPDRSAILAIQSLGARAIQADVGVFVWMVSSESFFTTQGALALQEMAIQTGGQFFGFSGPEPIPDIETYLEPLRSIYALSYESKITSSGSHELAVEINSNTFEAVTSAQSFELNVRPPNPIFVSPPARIYRSLVPETDTSSTGYTPNEQILEILLEFPDGYERPLVRTTLYVDGKISAENTQEPFHVFTWDLSVYGESARSILQVEAVDALGMSSVSIETPVDITVQHPPKGITSTVSLNSPVLVTIIVFMTGAILTLVLVLAGRIRPKPHSTKPKTSNDPVFQPVIPPEDTSQSQQHHRLTQWANQISAWLTRPQQIEKDEPYAFLEPLMEPNGGKMSLSTLPIPVSTPELTLGSDPVHATLVLEDSSISDLHARLRREKDGSFYLSDHDSIAGTWVNYAPASTEGTFIDHCDLIHIGRVAFRFKRNSPSKTYTPLILFEDQPQKNLSS